MENFDKKFNNSISELINISLHPRESETVQANFNKSDPRFQNAIWEHNTDRRRADFTSDCVFTSASFILNIGNIMARRISYKAIGENE